jgi:hypothetical protein
MSSTINLSDAKCYQLHSVLLKQREIDSSISLFSHLSGITNDSFRIPCESTSRLWLVIEMFQAIYHVLISSIETENYPYKCWSRNMIKTKQGYLDCPLATKMWLCFRVGKRHSALLTCWLGDPHTMLAMSNFMADQWYFWL